MKQLLILGFFAIVGLSANAQVAVTEDKIVASVTEQTTRQQLSEMRNELLSHGIDMRYENIEWNAQGSLLKIRMMARNESGEVVEIAALPFPAGQVIKLVVQRETGELCLGTTCE